LRELFRAPGKQQPYFLKRRNPETHEVEYIWLPGGRPYFKLVDPAYEADDQRPVDQTGAPVDDQEYMKARDDAWKVCLEARDAWLLTVHQATAINNGRNSDPELDDIWKVQDELSSSSWAAGTAYVKLERDALPEEVPHATSYPFTLLWVNPDGTEAKTASKDKNNMKGPFFLLRSEGNRETEITWLPEKPERPQGATSRRPLYPDATGMTKD
jgi:hypothetical protein